MLAVRIHDYGDADQLVLEEIPRPKPAKGEVLVRVHAAGVNPLDWKMRKYQRPEMPITFPYTPGADLSGTVEAIGPGVKAFKVGQAVFGSVFSASMGAYAEYAIVPEKALELKPDNITFDEAATVPIGARTAYIALFTIADLQEGQTLLVHGAAGGVGNFAVQLGRWKGAHVIGTASGANVEFVKSLGAEQVIDYNETRFEDVVSDVDVVLDSVGGEVEDRSWQVIKPGGILVTLIHPVPPENADHDGVRIASTIRSIGTPLQTANPLHAIRDLIAAGDIVPHVGAVFSLEQAREAQELCETGHGRGRIVLHIRD
jgi:NADPH:quinone reductase-like Zn-dependent oxidoreductase